MFSLVALLALTPPPQPTPVASRSVEVCATRLELPLGAVAVAKVCLVGKGETRCVGDDIIDVPESPRFGDKRTFGPKGVVLDAAGFRMLEERYERETRYLLLPSTVETRAFPYLVLPGPLPMEVETRACPDGPRFLEPKESLVIFAAGHSEIEIGKPLASVIWPASDHPWLVVLLERVK